MGKVAWTDKVKNRVGWGGVDVLSFEMTRIVYGCFAGNPEILKRQKLTSTYSVYVSCLMSEGVLGMQDGCKYIFFRCQRILRVQDSRSMLLISPSNVVPLESRRH